MSLPGRALGMVYKGQNIRDIWDIFVDDKGHPYEAICCAKGQG